MTLQAFTGLSIAVLLPWLAGGLGVRAVLAQGTMRNWPVVLGYGYPLGLLLTMGLMMLWDALGWQQSFWRSSGALLVLAAVAWLCARRPPATHGPARQTAIRTPLVRILCLVLVALITLRFGGFFLEIIWRPVFPWDAWFYYAPRAKVWFEYGSLIPFVSPSEWRGAQDVVFTAGSGRHPDGIPLIQLWMLQGLGRFDDALMNLPWFFAAVCVCLALYGMARSAGVSVPVTLAAIYGLVSLPMFGTHVALAGYGELWTGLYLLLACGGVYFGVRDRSWRPLLLALAVIVGMLTIKETSPLWIVPLLLGLLFGWLRLRHALALVLAAAVLVMAIAVIFGIEVKVGNLGHFALGPEGLEFPGYQPVWGALMTHLLLMANWHLLWVVMPMILVAAGWRCRTDAALRALFVTVLSGLVLLLLAFNFTHAGNWVIDGTSVNRVLLHLVPALILLAALICPRWTLQRPATKVLVPVITLGVLLTWIGLTLWVMYASSDGAGFTQSQTRLFDLWLNFRVWNTPSINRVELVEGDALISPSVAVLVWLSLCIVLAAVAAWLRTGLWRVNTPQRSLVAALLVVVAAGWLVLDLRWQAELLYRLNDSRSHFAGKNGDERRSADFDGPMFDFLQTVKSEISDPQARVWIFGQNLLTHLRARYHLLPQPALSSSDPLTTGQIRQLRSGDYVVLLDDQVVRPGGVRNVSAPPPHQLMWRQAPVATGNGNGNGNAAWLLVHEFHYPGYYLLRADVAGAGEYRVQVRGVRHGTESEVLAERLFHADQNQPARLAFLNPAPGQLEFRVLAGAEASLEARQIVVEWLPDQAQYAFLASERNGPFVLVKPFLHSDLGLVFEVL